MTRPYPRDAAAEGAASAALLPRAFPLERVQPAERTGLARQLGIKPRADLEPLRERLADGAFWDEQLARLPELSLLALEILCEAGGALDGDELCELIVERAEVVTGRSGLPHADMEHADATLDALAAGGLLVILTRGDNSDRIALLDAVAPALVLRVRGISLPEAPACEGAAASAPVRSRERDVVALAALTAHRRLRFTASLEPDRTTLKTFGRDLGVASDALLDLLREALGTSLLGARGERLLPHADRLLEGVASCFERGELRHWLDPGRWHSVEAMARAAWRATHENQVRGHAFLATWEIRPPTEAELFRWRDRVRALGGVDRTGSPPHDWLRPPERPAVSTGDGHVTPNFEVMLGPGADLGITAAVALGCELKRLDQVLVFEVTPRSVSAGLAAGLPAGRLRAALDRVGPRPAPDTVVRLIEESEKQTRVAPLGHGCFVFVPSESGAALRSGPLGLHLRGEPVPGALLLDPATPRELLEQALGACGLTLQCVYELDDANAQRDGGGIDPETSVFEPPGSPAAGDGKLPLGRPWSLEPAGEPALRSRLAGARERGFPCAAEQIHGARGGKVQVTSERVEEARAHLEQLAQRAAHDLQRLRRVLPRDDRALLDLALQEGPAGLAPLLVLKPKWRRRMVMRARSIEEVLELSIEHLAVGRLSEAGLRVMQLMDSPEVRLELGLGSEGPPARRAPGNEKPPPPPVDVGADLGEVDPELPSPGSIRPMTREQILHVLPSAVAHHAKVIVKLWTPAGSCVRSLFIDRVVERGRDQVLLATDPRTDESRVISLRQVESITWA